MDIKIAPGTYVVAVSGGVDSMVLLDLLRRQPGVKLVVAHFDHGIRPYSYMDRELVRTAAKQHRLPFVYHEGKLGPNASEEAARKARYDFLHAVRNASGAQAIITAHHHNDALETAIINLMRGTGRKGLSSLHANELVHRPLLRIPKQVLRAYANDQGLVWREDPTNQDTKYLRNHVRHNILPQFSDQQLEQLASIVRYTHDINRELDAQLTHYLHLQPAVNKLDRRTFVLLPHNVAREVLAAWLRNHGIRDFDQKTLERLVVGAKTLASGRVVDIINGHNLTVTNDYLALTLSDR